jgi:hypothetical protein
MNDLGYSVLASYRDSVVRNFVKKGLSREMDLAFDDMYG